MSVGRLRSWAAAAAGLAALLPGCGNDGPIVLNPLVADGMVLQHHSTVCLGGMAPPGTRVSVSTDWDFSVTASANADSTWTAAIRTPAADTLRHSIVFSTPAGSVTVGDVLIGEVWLAVSQSGATGEPMTDAAPGDSLARLFIVSPGASLVPARMLQGRWIHMTPQNIDGADAMAARFATELRRGLRRPVGVVVAANAGAPCRSWGDLATTDVSERREAEAEASEWTTRRLECQEWLRGLPSLVVPSAGGVAQTSGLSVYDEFLNASNPDTGNWPTMRLPGQWAHNGLPGFDGVVWLMRSVELPPDWPSGADMRIVLGEARDADVVYVNRTCVGSRADRHSYTAPGTYALPADVVKRRRRLDIAIRLDGRSATAGIYGPTDGSPMRMETTDGAASVPIDGEWRYCAAALLSEDGGTLRLLGMPDNRYMQEFRDSQVLPSRLRGTTYNAMLAPLRGLRLAGVLCHLGEADIRETAYSRRLGRETETVCKTLRELADDAAMPIVVSQVPSGRGCGDARMAQSEAVRRLGGTTRLVSLLDMGAASPYASMRARQEVEARRMARLVLHDVYARPSAMPASCPTALFALADGPVATVKFSDAEGLRIGDETVSAFEVAGADSVFFPAKAAVAGEWVTMYSHMVPSPVHVRYAHADTVRPTLWNSAGLPAAAFHLRIKHAQ